MRDSNVQKSYRYPGIQAFKREDAHIFFGRDKDQANIVRLVKLRQFLVLHGKSGLGKSSLLSAGVIPKLEDISSSALSQDDPNSKFQVLELRFGAYSNDYPYTPLSLFQIQIQGELGIHPLLGKVHNGLDDPWLCFKNKQLHDKEAKNYVLILDQFEELFAYPSQDVIEFKQRFTDLLNNKPPDFFQRKLREYLRQNPGDLSKEDKEKLNSSLSIKVIFSIRSDRLGLMDNFSSHIPNILVNLYELKPLEKEQASAAIVLPAHKSGNFLSPNFSYSDSALNLILEHLSDDNGTVEPFQIQYICQHAEKMVLEKGSFQLDENDFGGLEGIRGIFNNYYENQILTLEFDSRPLARRFIEEELIHEGQRAFILENKAKEFLSEKIIDSLVSKRILRKEATHLGNVIEISHDTLISPIQKSYQVRQAEIKALENKRLVKTRFINTVFALVLGIFIVLFLISNSYLSSTLDSIAQTERNFHRFWLTANEAVITSDDEAAEYCDFTLAYEILQSNNSIPIILVDDAGRVIAARNFGPDLDNNEIFLRNQFDNKDFSFLEGEISSIYYQDESKTLKRLRSFPFILIFMTLAMLLISILALRLILQFQSKSSTFDDLRNFFVGKN